jgi:flagellar motor switch protein FliM
MNAAAAQPISLLRQPQNEESFPAMDRVGLQFARGLRDYLATLDFGDASMDAVTSHVMPFGHWQAMRGRDMLFRFQLRKKLTVLVAVPVPMLLGLVDLFYGGAGAQGNVRDALTAAEQRFADRLASQFASMLAGAWSGTQPALGAMALSSDAKPFCPTTETVLVQSLPSGDIACVYPLVALRAEVGPDEETAAAASHRPDAEWSARVNAAALSIRLPVRTIFARPEISVAKLMALQTGDIIPLLLPQHVPITVSGRHFAEGNVGEASGRVAIKIENMTQGRLV